MSLMTNIPAEPAAAAIPDDLYQTYLQKLLAGEKCPCQDIVLRLLDQGLELKTLYLDLIQRSMYEVGSLWERHRISVAVEHLATGITEQMLTLVYPRLFARPRTGQGAVISCTMNEFHQIGGKMVADIFELHGWDGYFLGANTPLRDLAHLIEKKQPSVAGLSVSLFGHLPLLEDTLAELTRQFPSLPILVGGQAFQWGGAGLASRFPNVLHLPTIAALEAQIEAWGQNHKTPAW
jgi:methanogenic corrinoid protein MtbC1